MENYFKLSFPFVVYTQHCKIIRAIYIREGGVGWETPIIIITLHLVELS